ncbi:MAG TPA: GlsB/YeaQ/YmgE family stress response membrane protein [Ktedonobacterales bacterium]|nr:GlsB/YeaQ/YmgE family stress response membrane protein [Ktedonobacterales bacterium]
MHNILLAGPVALVPGGWLAWIAAGLLAGWLAGLIVRGRGFGCLGDIVLGIVGALIGGFVMSLLPINLNGVYGFWDTVVIAFFGALILAALGRLIGGSGRKRSRR